MVIQQVTPLFVNVYINHLIKVICNYLLKNCRRVHKAQSAVRKNEAVDKGFNFMNAAVYGNIAYPLAREGKGFAEGVD